MMSAMSGMRRPNLSPNKPKMNAPIGRIISVNVIANATSGIVRRNSPATGTEHESEQEKIERIQRPAEKAGKKGVALIVIERFEKTQRFHCPSPNCRVARSRAHLALARLASSRAPRPFSIVIPSVARDLASH